MDMELLRLLHGAGTVVKLEIPDIIACADLVTTAVGVYFSTTQYCRSAMQEM
jgi:hypothetical protein